METEPQGIPIKPKSFAGTDAEWVLFNIHKQDAHWIALNFKYDDEDLDEIDPQDSLSAFEQAVRHLHRQQLERRRRAKLKRKADEATGG